jgi:lipopolysaccharide export LptBFGC system permease protein LptF
VPFSALFVLVALISVAAIFIFSLRRGSLRAAILFSGIALVAFVAIFFIFLTLALNNM